MEITVHYHEDNSRKAQIINAINIINSAQNYFFYELESDKEVDICKEEYISWVGFKRNYVEKNKYIIYITEKHFDDNWFSHEESQYAIITTADWEDFFSPPSLKAYLVYQIAQASINFEGDLNENMEMRMVHDNPEGCMFDLCKNKLDIKLGMIAGNICPQCRSVLVQYGIDEKAISAVEKMLWYVRSEAVGRPIIFDQDAAFVVMRFSSGEDNENNNAFEYGIKEALESLGIKCIRADFEITSGQLLEKVERHIKRSRFIIVKVDAVNLNVYFELGMAMGLNKDILLLSEDQWVFNLPSDLRNWECLTYPKGNYRILKDKIIKYYIDNYHYKSIPR